MRVEWFSRYGWSVENSPAEDAGLLQGDHDVYQHKSSKDISMSEIYKLFQKGEGKPLNLQCKKSRQDVFLQPLIYGG
jgi:hypothetical protein